MKRDENGLVMRFRVGLALFLVGLVLSGVTAFPLVWELDVLCAMAGIPADAAPATLTGLSHWLAYVREGLHYNAAHYPFMAYGTDWLAYGHLTIAIFFIPAWLEPRSSAGTLWCGVAACEGILPLAHIAGPLRDIPMYWRLIDCSFGVFGAVPLFYCLAQVRKLTQSH